MPTHNWHFVITEAARREIRALSVKDRRLIFQSIRELLSAENPKTLVDVRKLVGKEFESLWRKRQGDYRIFFSLADGEVEFLKHTYQGTITIHRVVHRSQAY